MRYLLIIVLLFSINVSYTEESRFTIVGNGTIYDRLNGLIWQQTPVDKKMKWREAVQYAKNLNFADSSRWRLPTIEEWKKFLNGHLYQNVRRGAMEPWKWMKSVGFKNIRPRCYWSSNEDGTYRAWSLCLGEGQAASTDKNSVFNSSVICVRVAEM